MKIAMISGSPKASDSTSMYLLSQLEPMLQGDEITIVPADALMQMKEKEERRKSIRELLDRDAIVLSFPLYFDGIPSNLLGFMQEAEHATNILPRKVSVEMDEKGELSVSKTVLHVIVNNGFYEASQNETAIEMAYIWGDRCGFERGSSIAAGAGGMVQMAPMGRGPMHNLGAALKELAGSIRSFKNSSGTSYGGASSDNSSWCFRSKKAGSRNNSEVILVEPNFPRFLYIQCAHIGWHQMAKKNGLRAKDIEGIIKDKSEGIKNC